MPIFDNQVFDSSIFDSDAEGATSSGGRRADTLLLELRQALKDVAFSMPQFDIKITAGSTGLLEMTADHLILTGSAVSANVALGNVDSVENLVLSLNTIGNVEATLVTDADPTHSTLDFQVVTPPANILQQPMVINSHRWSDDELMFFIKRAISRHNHSVAVDPSLGYVGNYTVQNIPSAHFYFIILLSQIEAIKEQIQAGIKRKGIDLTVPDFVSLKDALEREYAYSLKAFSSRRVPLTSDQTKDIGSGDIVEGSSYRQSLHTARYSKSMPKLVPAAVVPVPARESLQAKAVDNQAGQALLSWSRSSDAHFNRYELWRGDTRDVSDISELVSSLAATGSRVMTQYDYRVTAWVDGVSIPLTPATYYYVLYVFNHNDQASPSNIVAVVVS
jgi:hypothetical protein